MIWDARLILLVIVLLNFHFQRCRDTRIPYLTRLADPSWSPVYSDVFNQNIYFILLKFYFQKCRDPYPRLDPVGGSKLEPGSFRHFQLSSQNICFVLLNFSFSKVSRPESPTRPERRIRTEARFTPTFLIKRKHFFSGNPMTIYKFKRLITFTHNIYKFNNMHLQNNAFISTYTHAIHFRMLSIYKSFTISYHAFSMQQFISQSIHEI